MRHLYVYVLCGFAMLILVSAPVLSAYATHVAIIAMFFAVLSASWSLLAGYAGVFSLAHMAFAAIGGYTSALVVLATGVPIPLGMCAGVVVCCLLGAFIGWICLRMSGPYLAIFTLGFSEIVRIALSTEYAVTQGTAGLHAPALFSGMSLLPYFYTAFGILTLSLAVLGLIVHSRWGLFFRAIREDDQAAAASGVAVARFRILVFAIACGFAGLAGGFYGHYIGILTPSLGSLDYMALVMVMAVIGGIERIPTAVGGAIAVEGLLEALRNYEQWRLPFFGLVLLFTMRFARNGLLTPVWDRFIHVGQLRSTPPVPKSVGQGLP